MNEDVQKKDTKEFKTPAKCYDSFLVPFNRFRHLYTNLVRVVSLSYRV